jgi:beta-phosphoglucomutase-like phosphatase (HAD superfamily)
VAPEECVVIEDSQIGVDAASGAGMRCVVTHTASTKNQAFGGAERILESLGDNPAIVTVEDLMLAPAAA